MSYDLELRHDEKYSVKLPRKRVHEIIQAIPSAKPNGDGGFTIERGKDVYMEVNVEFVNEEGDNIEEDGLSSEINCIRFHVPAAFQEHLDECIQSAMHIGNAVGWTVVDCQTGEEARIVPNTPSPRLKSAPWWKFW